MEALNDLKPANMSVVGRGRCLPGTRVQVLLDLFLALTHPNPQKKIIWLRGPAGSGKSTILNTLAHYLHRLDRQGTFLFFDQNDRDNSDPRRVILTLAHQLASFHPIFAEKILSDPSLARHYRVLIGCAISTSYTGSPRRNRKNK